MGKLFENVELAAARYHTHTGKEIEFALSQTDKQKDTLLQTIVTETKIFILEWLSLLKERENPNFAHLPTELQDDFQLVDEQRKKSVLEILNVAVASFSLSKSSKSSEHPFAMNASHPKEVVTRLKVANINPAMQILRNFLKKEQESEAKTSKTENPS